MSTPRTVTYDYASAPEELVSLLHDPEFLQRRCDAAGETNVEITVERTDTGVRVRVARDKKVDLPAFAKRLFTPQNRIVEDTRWTREGGQWVAEYNIEIQGIPGQAKGRTTLIPSASGCRYESAFEVTAKVPMFASKLEGFVADKLEETLLANAERNADGLAEGLRHF